MLRTKLFKAFALLVAAFAVLSAAFVIRVIQARIVTEAQQQVRLNLGSAWAVFNGQLQQIETVLRLLAGKKEVVALCEAQDWDHPEMQDRLEATRVAFGLDYLTLLAPDGKVVMRCAPPYHTGDYRLADAAVGCALKGEPCVGLGVLSDVELRREGDGLAERASLVLDATPGSRPTPKPVEPRGMVMKGAIPIRQGTRLVGILYGGVLLNRNERIVDHIRNTVFRDAVYHGQAVGSATIFLEDSRIATTVRLPNGNRALGTRVSKEVADRVLDNGQPWVGRALVVNDWSLTAYDPLRDPGGRVIGMLYVGTLEKPFRDLARDTIVRYAGLSALALVAALGLAFFYAARLAAPTHRLVQMADLMRAGQRPPSVPSFPHASQESNTLVAAFNQMAAALDEREARLLEAKQKLEAANQSLSALNRAYMDMLEFVSHELKSPLSAILNYVYLLKTAKLGAVTDKQAKALRVVDTNLQRLVEMVRHYLNLSRIESGELAPILGRVDVLADVVQPLLDTFDADLLTHRIRVANGIEPGIMLRADVNLVREVFENLISNAIKYGREGGALTLSGRRADALAAFAVRNEGEGIPPDQREAVFQKFTRLTAAPAVRARKGTGLGLFITRAIVEAHGGRIDVESHPGAWIEFRFTLPRWTQEEGS